MARLINRRTLQRIPIRTVLAVGWAIVFMTHPNTAMAAFVEEGSGKWGRIKPQNPEASCNYQPYANQVHVKIYKPGIQGAEYDGAQDAFLRAGVRPEGGDPTWGDWVGPFSVQSNGFSPTTDFGLNYPYHNSKPQTVLVHVQWQASGGGTVIGAIVVRMDRLVHFDGSGTWDQKFYETC